jgi:hypothetical protein
MPEETPAPAPTEATPEEGCGKQFLGCFGMCLAFGVFVGGCSMLFDNKPDGYRDCFDAASNLMRAQGVGFLERSGRAKEMCE